MTKRITSTLHMRIEKGVKDKLVARIEEFKKTGQYNSTYSVSAHVEQLIRKDNKTPKKKKD